MDGIIPDLYRDAKDPKQSWYHLWAVWSQWDGVPHPSHAHLLPQSLNLYPWTTVGGIQVRGSSVDHVCVQILKICLKRRPLVARVILVQVGTRNKAAFQGPHGL